MFDRAEHEFVLISVVLIRIVLISIVLTSVVLTSVAVFFDMVEDELC